MKWIWPLTTLLVTGASLALAAGPPPCVPLQQSASLSYDLGLSLEELLFPNTFDDNPNSLPIYGPRVGIPFLGNKLIGQAGYGAADPGTSIILVQTAYQIPFKTPFFDGFVEAGIHYLHYAVLGKNHDMPGVNLGIGLTLPMGKDFAMSIALKTYLQQPTFVSLGGGFSFLL